MRFNHKQYGQALYEAFHDTKSSDHDKIIANFIEVLKSNGDLAEYEKIVEVYEDYDRKQRGVKEVKVTTARDVTINKDLLTHLNDMVGGDVEVKQKVDSNLIGGIM